MLQRKITQELLHWKETRGKECLVVRGARQVGKTYIIRDFGKNHYKHFVELNFEKTPELKEIFEGSLDVDELIKKISLSILGVDLIPKETLIFLDEIQSCPKARTSLKFFAEDERFDVIASGSLLGINYREVSSYPVGYEKQLQMHSLDLEEFLWAIGVAKNAIGYLQEYFEKLEKIPFETNETMIKYMREYMAIGGMPAVINRYLKTKNFNDVQDEQDKITQAYLNDIAKYAPYADKPKARNCFLSIPKQLAKENKKFMYSKVEKRGTARKYANSLDWLRDASLITFCTNVSTPTFPLVAYEKEEQFKVYMNDIGLLVSLYGFEMKSAIINNTLKGPSKGGIYENLIADILIKKDIPLNYYKKENNSQEIEFLLKTDTFVIPVEVKAGNTATLSLNTFLEQHDVPFAYKFITGNIGVMDKKKTLPLYMAMFL